VAHAALAFKVDGGPDIVVDFSARKPSQVRLVVLPNVTTRGQLEWNNDAGVRIRAHQADPPPTPQTSVLLGRTSGSVMNAFREWVFAQQDLWTHFDPLTVVQGQHPGAKVLEPSRTCHDFVAAQLRALDALGFHAEPARRIYRDYAILYAQSAERVSAADAAVAGQVAAFYRFVEANVRDVNREAAALRELFESRSFWLRSVTGRGRVFVKSGAGRDQYVRVDALAPPFVDYCYYPLEWKADAKLFAAGPRLCALGDASQPWGLGVEGLWMTVLMLLFLLGRK
jgi:hypothetical protein